MSESKIDHIEMVQWLDQLSSDQRKVFYEQKHKLERELIIHGCLNIIPEIIKTTVINAIVGDIAAYCARRIELDEPMHVYLEQRMNVHKYSNFDLKVNLYVKGHDIRIDRIEIKFNHEETNNNKQSCCIGKESCN